MTTALTIDRLLQWLEGQPETEAPLQPSWAEQTSAPHEDEAALAEAIALFVSKARHARFLSVAQLAIDDAKLDGAKVTTALMQRLRRDGAAALLAHVQLTFDAEPDQFIFDSMGASPSAGAEIWPDRDMLLRKEWLFTSLLSADFDGFANAMRQASADLFWTILISANAEASLDLPQLIADAPEAITPKGEPANRLAFALLAVTSEALAGMEESAQPAFVQQVLNALLSRADGERVARAWLERLVAEEGRLRRWRNQSDAFSLLFTQLCGRVSPLGAAAYGHIAAASKFARIERLLGELALLHRLGEATEAAILLGKAISSLDLPDTGRERAFDPARSEAKIIGATLASMEAPADWFDGLWRSLYEARERARFTNPLGNCPPARIAIAWALAGVNHCDAAKAIPLWNAVAAALRIDHVHSRASLSEGLQHANKIAATVIGLALARDFGLAPAMVQRLLADLAEPTPSFAHLALVLIGRDGGGEQLLGAMLLLPADMLAQSLRIGASSMWSRERRIDWAPLEAFLEPISSQSPAVRT